MVRSSRRRGKKQPASQQKIKMGDRSCFMQLPGGGSTVSGEKQMGSYQQGGGNKAGSAYQAKELQEEFCMGGGGGGSAPKNAPAPAGGFQDAGDRSCFMGLPGGK